MERLLSLVSMTAFRKHDCRLGVEARLSMAGTDQRATAVPRERQHPGELIFPAFMASDDARALLVAAWLLLVEQLMRRVYLQPQN
jgi:hypothetical protein